MHKPKPLSEIIIAALPAFDGAPTVKDVSNRLGFDQARVRAAFDALEASGAAKIVRRGRGLHLLPADHPCRVCPICRGEIRGYGRTCSKSCGMKVAWQKRDRARQGDVFRETHRRVPEKFRSFSALRDNPAHKQFVSDRNRKDWADPVKKMRRVVAMEAAWQGPQADGRRAKASKKKLELWDDPVWAAKTIAAMRTGWRGRFQRAVIDLVGKGLSEVEIAARTGRTIDQTVELMRRLFRLGKIDRAPADRRKNRQSQAVIANRFAKTIALRAARRAAS